MSNPTLHILEDILYNYSGDRRFYKDPELWISTPGFPLMPVTPLPCPYFKVTPHQWEIIYDIAPYRTITGRTVQKVRGYKPYWEVEAVAVGRRYYSKLVSLFAYQLNLLGDDMHPIPRIYFFPPGDDHRPCVEVDIILGNEFRSEYFAGKYRGYTFKFRIEGRNIYPRPVLPRFDSSDITYIPTVLGVVGCGWE